MRSLKDEVSDKQQEVITMNTRLRQEGIRNQKLKREVADSDERVKSFINKQVESLFEKCNN